ncbi:hypothetical protein BS47DRAFT_1166503 [Hydnum rufescens UP504]|uniref:Uncharacterized protein n=1 Tax=Hydnum rufescens UP504 TaxID=1448309 RepID=A0A9P6AT65_9AGAM|nr:hypothetical protein BS47DRAFT_1166503 [Hydnum rufescens UP504]
MEDSPDYKWYSENCFFFCAVIYENLVSVGQGVNVSGAPRKISLSLAPELKARIKKRLESLEPSPGIPSLDLRGVFPMGAVSTTPPSGRLPNEFSVAEEREEIARKYRPIPSGKSRSFVRLERPQTAASERVGVFQRLQRLCGFF